MRNQNGGTKIKKMLPIIVSMNANDVPMGGYPRYVGDIVQSLCVSFMKKFVIDDNILVFL